MSEHVSLPGIPESIPRAAYQDLIRGLGFELADLTSLEFQRDGIYAEVFARNAEGHRYTADGENVATHRVCIRITDEKEATPA